MIYLDYAASHPVIPSVRTAFCKASEDFANANSLHAMGQRVLKKLQSAEAGIRKILGLGDTHEVVFTSGASEANNFLIQGLVREYPGKKHIISSPFEHSSIVSQLNELAQNGYRVDILGLTEQGEIDLNHLRLLLDDDTLLVSIVSVDSELGIRQPLAEISSILSTRPGIYFHSDITQSLFKEPLNVEMLDFASFSAHKFGGFKGIGALIKRKDIRIHRLITGGKSLSKLRSGTPSTELILSTEKAMKYNFANFEKDYYAVKEIKDYAVNRLKLFPEISVNSPIGSLPHILNISILTDKDIDLIGYFSSKGICVGSQSACEANQRFSPLLFRITKDKRIASHSVRLSFSYQTKISEVDIFLTALKELVS